MTDTPEGRLDLRALDASDDPERADTVVAAVMSRVREAPSDLLLFYRYRRRLLAAAAVLAAIATGAIATAPRSAGSATDLIADWATSSHVPTNGELLAAFHGYRP